jgi:pyruvate dehydrogenase E2 component (dihydrolipoamide acetyltransferase)
MALVEVKVPDIGDFDEVGVIELLVKVGDTVKAEQSLITVESDKASMEIPSSHAGVVKELKVQAGRQGQARLGGAGAGGRWRHCRKCSTSPLPPASSIAKPAAPALQRRPGSGRRPPQRRHRPVEVRVPDIGDFKDVAVIELLVKPGDTVKAGASLITVESDKASMEIPSPARASSRNSRSSSATPSTSATWWPFWKAGACAAAACTSRGCTAPAPAVPAAAAPAAAAPQWPRYRCGRPCPPTPPARPLGPAARQPSVRKFARELGVPLAEVKGSGPKGRITQDDVQAFTKAVMAAPRKPRRRRQGTRRRRRRRAWAWACCPGPRSTSPSSARSSARTSRASRRSAAPTCTATGS